METATNRSIRWLDSNQFFQAEFETIRRRMSDEVTKLQADLEEETSAVKEMRAEIAAQPTVDELRTLADQLRAEVRELIEMNVKLAREENALEEKEKENVGASPVRRDGEQVSKRILNGLFFSLSQSTFMKS